MAIEGLSRILNWLDFDNKALKKAISEFNKSDALDSESRIKTAKVKDKDLVESFIKTVEAVPNSKEPAIPEVVINLYNSYVDILEGPEPEPEDEQEDKQETQTRKREEKPMPRGKKKEKETKVKEKPATKKKETKAKTKAPAKDAGDKITKKSVIIKALETKSGATIDQMAQKCTDAGLGDFDRNKKTVGLWLKKIGFEVKQDSKGRWSKA